MKIRLLILLLLAILVSHQIFAYKVESGTEVHQYITNESIEVWKLIPYEIKAHAKNPLTTNINDVFGNPYNPGDDIIDGSGEADKPDLNVLDHFWEPDNPSSGWYSDGLFAHDSSYELAKNILKQKVIPLYLKGEINESYYWLGRIVHLLEDATVPAHMHLDPHPISDLDSLEEYTGANFTNYRGSTYIGQQYNHEKLPNLNNFDWSSVDANSNYKQYIELFRLFWYAAQKTQYYASDDENGNDVYRTLSGSQPTFSPSLWLNENSNIISQSSQVPANVDKIANATLPHAMKAVAGLYRLFWDYAHTDWPTFHHTNERTGFTILKGDMTSASKVNKLNLVLEGNVNQDHFSRASIADIDNDGKQDIVIASSRLGSGTHDGIIFNSELSQSGTTLQKKWQVNVGYEVEAPPSIGNIDTDDEREMVFGFDNGTFVALNPTSSSASIKWSFTVQPRYSVLAGGNFRGDLAFSAIENVDTDSKKEILFLEGIGTLPDWPGNVYILEDNGNSATLEANYTLGNGGGRGAPSITDIDGDNKFEIIAPSYYGVFVFDYDTLGVLTKKWNNNHGKINGAVAVADVDKDNEYELIYTTHTDLCHASKTCYNRLYITNAKTGVDEVIINLTAVSRTTPAIGDIDNDGDVEIVFNLEEGTGKIACYEINGNTCGPSWPKSISGINATTPSPDIADIDGDGQYDILFTRSNSKKMGVLNGNGNLKFEFNLDGMMGSAPALADVDNDGVAEIAVKRAGSPITVLTAVSYDNNPPRFTREVANITLAGIAGKDILINSTGDINVEDPDGDAMMILYSPPFNVSGMWNTSINDEGNYTFFVEVNDGNLSSIDTVDIQVFNANTKLVNTFSDNTTSKALSFTGSESKNATIRLPKDSSIVFSRIRIRGTSP